MNSVTNWFWLPAATEAVPCGRQFARKTLADWGLEQMGDVPLVVSELLANAVTATRTDQAGLRGAGHEGMPEIAVRLCVRECGPTQSLLVEVWDTSPVSPQVRTPDPEAEHGRGLLMITLLSERWGWRRALCGGKIVHAQLSIPVPPTDVVGVQKEPYSGHSRADATSPEATTDRATQRTGLREGVPTRSPRPAPGAGRARGRGRGRGLTDQQPGRSSAGSARRDVQRQRPQNDGAFVSA